jgi:uncharacterized RDD family membrane protein YckC
MTGAAPMAGALETPALWRRLACFFYEGVLLFGVVMAAGLLYAIVTGQRNAMQGRLGLVLFLFAVLGAYFVWFWSHSGQTLAMQTWHIRVLTEDGRPVTGTRAIARYLLSYLWFMPALLALWFTGSGGSRAAVALALTAGVLVYAALTRLHPQRQYWHDAVCRTRLVTWQPQHAS